MKRPFLTVFFFVGLGAVLLALNLGIFNLGEVSWKTFIIPGVLIVLGAVSLDSYTKHNRVGMAILWGLFAFTFGLLNALGILGILNFTYGDWLKLWPIIFIALGLHQLFKKPDKKKKSITITYDNDGEEKTFHQKKRPVDSLKFNEQDWALEPMDRFVNIGTFFFDFSKAIIPIGETAILLKGNVGDIKILAPDHLPLFVTLKSNVLSADVFGKKENGLRLESDFKSPGYDDAERRIRILIDYHVLDVKIKQV